MDKQQINEAAGLKLKTLRKTLGYSQDDVAANVGLTRTSIVNIEKGRQSLTLENLYKIAEFFKIEASELFIKKGGDIDLVMKRKIFEIESERNDWREKYLKLTKSLKEVMSHIDDVRSIVF